MASIPLALLVLARPDGALFTAALVLGLVLVLGPRRSTFRLALGLAALPAAAWIGNEAFRLLYYHSWVPNPARVKIAFTVHRLTTGLGYLGKWAGSSWPLVLLGAMGLGLANGREERTRSGLILVALLVWLGYVVAIGGDFFPAYRHLVPVVGLLALLAADAVQRLARRWGSGWAVAIGIVLLVPYGLLQLRHQENTRARDETWVWGARAVARVLGSSFGLARPLMAVTAAGSFPYWTGFPSLDMLGLNDAYIASHAPPDFGQGWAGHELGDAPYVLRRAPDLIQFSAIRRSEETGYFRVEQDLARTAEFRARYRLVTFEASSPREARWRIWVRWESPRIGVARTSDMLRVPGYLLTLNPATVASLDEEGRLGIVASSDSPAGIAELPLPPGRWGVSIDPESPELAVGVRPAGSNAQFVETPNPREIRIEPGMPLDFLLAVRGAQPVRLRQVVFRRTS